MCLGNDDPPAPVAVNTVKPPVEAAPGALQPDPADPSGKSAQLAARMRLLALDGLRSTFTTGYRGEGGPSRAASQAQIDWRTAPAPVPTPAPSTPPGTTGRDPIVDTSPLTDPGAPQPFSVDSSAPGGKGKGPKPVTSRWWQP